MTKYYYVYMITNVKNSVVYIGITSDLVKRIYQHREKFVKGFSSKYNLKKLVYYEILDDPSEAIKREKQLKNLVRRKKDELISSFNPKWNDVYNDILK